MLNITYDAQQSLGSRFDVISNATTDLSLNQIKSSQIKKRFRIKVTGGGCSGFQYKFSIDDQTDDDDIILSHDLINFEVVIDKHSLPLIQGSSIDHSTSLSGEYFFLKNPNAKAKCGCGSSFAV